MWDAVSSGLQPQPWHHNIIWAPPYPNFANFGPHLRRFNSVGMHPYAHQQHMKVLKHLYTSNMDVGCSQWWFTASNMSPQCHLGSAISQLSNICPPPAQVLQCKDAPISPSTAYEGAQTLYISNLDVGFRHWWFTASTMTLCNSGSALPQYFKILPPPAQVQQCKNSPYTHPQHMKGIQTHFIYI
jgi:hypothetical protein